MSFINFSVPHLTTAHAGPLFPVEAKILDNMTQIESWFRSEFAKTPAPLMSSVDLRHAGYKLAPVDTNLFPAGFNNLNSDFMPMCIQAAQSTLGHHCTKILLLPESHTRNQFYMKSLSVLRDIFVKAGFIVRIGSLDPNVTSSFEIVLDSGDILLFEPLVRLGNKIGLLNFDPCLLMLNNDLSSGVSDILVNIKQRIEPIPQLGWSYRLKSSHFEIYNEVVNDFSKLINLDPWFINPLFNANSDVNFMQKTGVESVAHKVDELIVSIRQKYEQYNIVEKPFVVVKADNGTYGMSVMMVNDGSQLLNLNRKQRTGMATTKGSRTVSRVLIQEGVYSSETMPNGSVAEPVVYMIGSFVVGGFYRVHKGRSIDDNLNAPGMHFEPLAFANACNMPSNKLKAVDIPNRFYAYGVVARLAALAAAREIYIAQRS